MNETTPHDSAAPPRRLRRSRDDRVGAGVAGGLGEYFGVDPVLFRVLFATAAFFGGAGILAYLLAWAAIPEVGTEHAPIDNWMATLRRKRVPVWLLAVAAGVLLWVVAFSWWAPGPFIPVVAVVIVLVIILSRNARHEPPEVANMAPPDVESLSPTVSLSKEAGPTTTPQPPRGGPPWLDETRSWIAESRAARRERIRRAMPVRVATALALVGTLVTLGLIDAARGILLPVYFWCTLGIVGLGLFIGAALRRTPWSLAWLLIPGIVGAVAFGGTRASLHDGIGQRTWTPTAVSGSYKLAFGKGTLDLRHLAPANADQAVRVDMASGQVRVIVPPDSNITVDAHVRFGVVETGTIAPDGTVDAHDVDHGAGFSHTVGPSARATGSPVDVNVHLATGLVEVLRATR